MARLRDRHFSAASGIFVWKGNHCDSFGTASRTQSRVGKSRSKRKVSRAGRGFDSWSRNSARGEICSRPSGTGSTFASYPALKRRAIVGYPSGAEWWGFSSWFSGSQGLYSYAGEIFAVVAPGLDLLGRRFPALKRRAIVGFYDSACCGGADKV